MQSSTDAREQLRRVVEAHVRYHSEHAHEAFVGNREIQCLDEPDRGEVLKQRHQYDLNLRELIVKGVAAGVFDVSLPRLASYSILDLGVGVSVWYRASGAISCDDMVAYYVDFALRLVGVPGAGAEPGLAAHRRRGTAAAG